MPDYSATGVELIDGRPYFATYDGVRMNRKQWLDATRPARTAELVEALRLAAEPDDTSDTYEQDIE